jgi:hypothetical protein
LKSGETDANARAGIWYGDNNPRNTSIQLPEKIKKSKGAAELAAILTVLQQNNNKTKITFITQSKFLTATLSKELGRWEKHGYIGINNTEILQPLAAKIRQHKAELSFREAETKSLDGIKIKKAKELAKEEISNDTPTVNLTIHPNWKLPGAQLSEMTQHIMYLGIRTLTFPQRKHMQGNTSMEKTYHKNINMIKEELKSLTGKSTPEEKIWTRCTCSSNATKEQNIWMWKAIHNYFWVGRRWLHIPGYEERATCQYCEETESMEHILTKCQKPGQDDVWKLARNFLSQKMIELPHRITMGLVLGCSLTDFKDARGKRIPGATRIVEIVMRESITLIWQLRNMHVIEHNNADKFIPTASEIKNKFLTHLNNRLQLDLTLLNDLKFGKKSLPKEHVMETWQGTIKNYEPPDDWTKKPRVLVGMGEDIDGNE